MTSSHAVERLRASPSVVARVLRARTVCAVPAVRPRAAPSRPRRPTLTPTSPSLSSFSRAGKYFHRYKRQRPCTYTRDYETHLRLRVDDDVKNPKPRKRGGAAAAAVAAAGVAAGMAEAAARSARTSGRGTPASQAMSPQSSGQEDDSDDDDDDEPVLPHGAKRRRPAAHYGSPDTPFVQLDTDDSGRSSGEGSPPATRQRTLPPGQPSPPPPGMPTIPGPAAVTAPLPVPSPVRLPLPRSRTAAAGIGGEVERRSRRPRSRLPASRARLADSASLPLVQQPLPWMLEAAAELRAKQVDDRFEIIPRPRPSDPNVQEWRIRCLDCPGKVRPRLFLCPTFPRNACGRASCWRARSRRRGRGP